ncbi:MAG: amidase [Acidobacteriota bacterium]
MTMNRAQRSPDDDVNPPERQTPSEGLTRREVLTLLNSAALGAYALSCGSAPRAPSALDTELKDPLYYSSATALAHAIRKKDLSSEEIVRVYLARIEKVNPAINAVILLAADAALERARTADASLARGESLGPLHGVPMTLKDSIDTAGMVSTGGTLGRANFVPERDATVAARLRAAGAIFLGKTNTPELTGSFETNNLLFGFTHNPYDLQRTPGGSSGGAAAIVASGGTAMDIGSDTGGSIRYPSHCCGIAGIKPTSGRVPRTGHIVPFGGILDTFTTLGPMARTVDDLILTLPLIAGPDWRDPSIVPMPLGDPQAVDLKRLRVSFHTDNGIATPTPETMQVVRRAGEALSAAGLSVEEVRPTGIEESLDIINAFWGAEGGYYERKVLEKAGTTKHSLTWMEEAKPITMHEFGDLIDRWDAFRVKMLTFFENFDVILSPVNGAPAQPHAKVVDDDPTFTYTETYNLTGWPAAVIRCGTSPEGLPIGVQVVAQPWREDVALAVASHLEKALGGFEPPAGL